MELEGGARSEGRVFCHTDARCDNDGGPSLNRVASGRYARAKGSRTGRENWGGQEDYRSPLPGGLQLNHRVISVAGNVGRSEEGPLTDSVNYRQENRLTTPGPPTSQGRV